MSDSAPRAIPPLPASLAALWPLLGRPIALHPRLAEACGGVKTALLLSQALYWTRTGVGIREHDGWFHKRIEDWTRETGLGRRSQERARRRLAEAGVVETRLAGLPARLEYRVNKAALRRSLLRGCPDEASADLDTLAGAPLAFHASLAGLTHSVTAGLLLSRLLHLTRARQRHGAYTDGWIARRRG